MAKLKQDNSIGKNLRTMRNAVHLTQEEMAVQLQLYGCKTTRDIYAQMESGTYNIRISELLAMKEIFHCEYADFFAGLPRPEKAGSNE